MPKPPGTPGMGPAKILAVSDSLRTSEDTSLVISASTLLANDTDPFPNDPYALRITSVQSGTGGTATYNPSTQQITFVPTADFTGDAAFTYTITDGRNGTSTATESVHVVADFNTNLFTVDYLFPSPTVHNTGEVAGRIEPAGDPPEFINVTASPNDFFDLDFDNDHIIFDFITAGGPFLAGAAVRITDTYGQLDDIVGVRIVSNTLTSFDQSDISFTANSLLLDLSGAGGWTANTVLDLQVLFG